MLKKARTKNSTINWVKGTAEEIPLSDNIVDGVIAGLTTHHWQNLKKGFKEVSRVMKPNGRLVIFTSTPKQMLGYWLNHYFPKMIAQSCTLMPSLDQTIEALTEAGLNQVSTKKYFIKE